MGDARAVLIAPGGLLDGREGYWVRGRRGRRGRSLCCDVKKGSDCSEPLWGTVIVSSGLRAAAHERVLEAEEVEDVAEAAARALVAVAGVGIVRDEGVLEGKKVEDVQDAGSR